MIATAVRFRDTLIALPFSFEKSTNAMSVPCPTNSVCEPSTKDGSQDDRCERLTMTWNDPLAASYLLSELIDFSSAGELRSTVVSANGFLKLGQQVHGGQRQHQRDHGGGDNRHQRGDPPDPASPAVRGPPGPPDLRSPAAGSGRSDRCGPF